jgi:flagellar protein FlgJ
MDKMPPLPQASLGADSAFGRPAISAKNAGPEELRQAAEAFESMFVRMILAQGHQTQLADGLFDSKKDDSFQSMLDAEYAESVAGQADLGIASALYAQFSGALPKVKE